MKQAKLIVIRKDYRGDTAIDNVIGYAIDSYFADLDEMITSCVRTDSYDHMVEDFYRVQASRDMTNHRRLFHFILSTPIAKGMERTLGEGARDLVEYFENLGHQVIAVPHYSSEHNYLHYHYHVIVNSVSYLTGKILYERHETYNAIVAHLNLNPFTRWSWMYKGI